MLVSQAMVPGVYLATCPDEGIDVGGVILESVDGWETMECVAQIAAPHCVMGMATWVAVDQIRVALDHGEIEMPAETSIEARCNAAYIGGRIVRYEYAKAIDRRTCLLGGVRVVPLDGGDRYPRGPLPFILLSPFCGVFREVARPGRVHEYRALRGGQMLDDVDPVAIRVTGRFVSEPYRGLWHDIQSAL